MVLGGETLFSWLKEVDRLRIEHSIKQGTRANG